MQSAGNSSDGQRRRVQSGMEGDKLHPGINEAKMAAAMALVHAAVLSVRPDGTVWRHEDKRSGRLDPPRRSDYLGPGGYRWVAIPMAGSRAQHVPAHRLIWTALKGPIPLGIQINHIDCDKTNNRPDNLELVTPRENSQHARRMGRIPIQTNPKPKLTAPQSERMREALRRFAAGEPARALAAELGVNRTGLYGAAKKYGVGKP